MLHLLIRLEELRPAQLRPTGKQRVSKGLGKPRTLLKADLLQIEKDSNRDPSTQTSNRMQTVFTAEDAEEMVSGSMAEG